MLVLTLFLCLQVINDWFGSIDYAMCTSCLNLESAVETGAISCQLFSGESSLLDAGTSGPNEVLCLQ
jgi:hypothetical protein